MKKSSSPLRTSINAIEQWMRAHGAPRLAENLAAGASERQLDAAEKTLGVKLPEHLRELYRIHDGQPNEEDCFIENLRVLPLASAVRTHEAFLDEYDALLVSSEPSKGWWPIAIDGEEGLREVLATNLESGRVFWLDRKNPPHVRLAANDLPQFFALYERAIVDGKYEIREGYGDYYLARTFEWAVPDAKVRTSRKPAAEVVEDCFHAVLGNNLFFLLEDVTVKKGGGHVVLALHRHPAFHEKLVASSFVRAAVEAFTAALKSALPQYELSVSLVGIDVDANAFALYLQRTGSSAAPLLRELEAWRKVSSR